MAKRKRESVSDMSSSKQKNAGREGGSYWSNKEKKNLSGSDETKEERRKEKRNTRSAQNLEEGTKPKTDGGFGWYQVKKEKQLRSR